MSGFEMVVMEKFMFSDGTTVLAGIVSGRQKPIPKCECNVVVNGEKLADIRVDGEMLVEHRGASPQRAVSTRDTSKLEGLPFSSGQWRLISNSELD